MIFKELGKCSDAILDKLVLLDYEAVCRYGKSFSEEIWTKSNFICKLPHKESKSIVVFDENMAPQGFCIISLKNNEDSYIHRFVSKNSSKIKVSDLLILEVLKRNKNISLVVNSTNRAGIDFYQKYGFEIVHDKITQKKIFPNETPLLYDDSVHEDYKFLMSNSRKKKILCNISGHEIESVLNDEMQLVQTY